MAHTKKKSKIQDPSAAEKTLSPEPVDIVETATSAVQRLVHELQIHQVELETQNNELREAQIELTEARDRYTDLYDFAPVGYVTLDHDGVVVEANLTAAELLGVARSSLPGMKLSRFIDRRSQDMFYKHRRELLASEQKQTCDLEMRRNGLRWFARIESAMAFEDTARLAVIMFDITDRMQAENERRELEKEILDVAEAEKRRIGREVHDGLAQELTAMSLFSKALLDDLKSEASLNTGKASRLYAMVMGAHEHTRMLSHGLLTSVQDLPGLVDALRNLSVSTSEMTGIPCTFVSKVPVLVNDLSTATHLYHIAQEAVNNAVRHSQSSRVIVSLEVNETGITLSVQDDGKGFEPDQAPTESMGLRIMRYRADLIEAYLDIQSTPDNGTTLICTIGNKSNDE